LIRFEHVSKKFKEHDVLSDLSFEVENGRFVAIIGASGCGKTTTLKMINRLINPTSGKILIDDEDIAKKDVIELRRGMGYVIQQTGLFPHLTVRSNIEMIPRVQKRNPEKIAARTVELMEMVGLDTQTFLDRYPTELSGGQQQRVGVARAFATDPEIVLMDEPFSALDPITREGLQDELLNLQAKLKKTIVFVTHDMDEAVKLADRILIMDRGCIVQYDTPENILKNPANEFVSRFVGRKRIWASPDFIKAEDIMIENPVTCAPSLSLFRCLERMRSLKVDSLMVVENGSLRGILTAEQALAAKDRSAEAGSVMTRDILHVSPQETIVDVLKLVNENRISTVPVLNEAGALVGLITRSSLVTTLSGQFMETEAV
jgi:glycine betaine/L-proline transport ATP binding subunit